MTTATRLLMQEHDLILRALLLLETAAERMEASQSVPDAFPAWAVDFIAEFADRQHHAKEEDVLFPALERRGVPKEGGPLGCMMQEHVLGRQYAQRMRAAVEHDPLDVDAFVQAARQYIPLLRQHILKENNVLFMMADQLLDEATQATMVRQFAQTAADEPVAERFPRELSEWEQRLSPRFRNQPA